MSFEETLKAAEAYAEKVREKEVGILALAIAPDGGYWPIRCDALGNLYAALEPRENA